MPPTPRSSTESIAPTVLVPAPGPLAPAHAPAEHVSPVRAAHPWWAVPVRALVDASLVLVCAAVLAGVGAAAPLPVVAVATVVWPLLLVVLGARSAGPVGRTVATGRTGVVRAVAVAALACWLLHPVVGSTTSPERVVPLLALLGIVTAVGATLFPLARPLRVVLAGAASDVSTALDELGPSPRFDVRGRGLACFPRAGRRVGPGAALPRGRHPRLQGAHRQRRHRRRLGAPMPSSCCPAGT